MQDKYTFYFLENTLNSKYLFDIMKVMRYTFAQFKEEYPDDAACLRSVLENRYGDTCPKCGVIGVKFYPITGRKGFVCSECTSHVYPLADTIFRKSETSLWNWFYAIYLFSVSKNGVSAKELERHFEITYKTAWRMCKQIRLLMEQDNDQLTGEIEVDETYIGGRRKLAQKFHNKSIVFGMVERNGTVKSSHVKSSGSRSLVPVILKEVAPASSIHSDEWRAYKVLPKHGYSHTTVNHSKLEYVRGNAHTNTIEGYWSQLKRSIDGTYHSVSPKYLQQYLNEFSFRYNFRAVAVFPVLLERAAKLS